MIRRMLAPVRAAALVTWAWRHRGSVIRSADLTLRFPDRLRRGNARDAVLEAKAIARLDHRFAPDVTVRLQSLVDGEIVLRAGLDPEDLGVVRSLLAHLPGIVDVRTDVMHQPTIDDALSAAS